MKRWIMTLAVVLATVPAMASGEVNTTGANDAYDMSVDMRKLGCALGLSLNQVDEMSTSYARFNEAMKNVGKADKNDRTALTEKAVRENFKAMKLILKPTQFNKYEQLITVTLVNRGIIAG